MASGAQPGFVTISQREYEDLLKRAIRVENRGKSEARLPTAGHTYTVGDKFKAVSTRMMELPVEEQVKVPVEKAVVHHRTGECRPIQPVPCPHSSLSPPDEGSRLL